MPKHLRILLALFSLALLALAPLGCSSDDDGPNNPGGGDPVDDVIPLVLNINPGHRSFDVPVDQDITVAFSEPMDPATADGDIALTLGAITALTWNATGTVLTVEHDTWAAGRPVGVTVGTGLTDAAGNALPEEFAADFYTESTTAMLMDVILHSDADGVIPSSDPVFVFSVRMDLSTIHENTTVTETGGGKAVPEFRIGTMDGETRAVKIDFVAPLDPLTEYRIEISGDILIFGGPPLGTPLSVTFTTGATVDEEDPYILSTTPALDSVAPRDLEKVVINFNEPISPFQVEPDEMSALLVMYSAREPVWNTDGDRLTLYLQRPLPAGMRLWAIFDQEVFRDRSGNYNTAPDSVSFTTEGTASLFPVRDDVNLYYDWEGDAQLPARQDLHGISGDNFERVMVGWDGDGYDTVLETWRMTMGDSGLLLRGLTMDETPVTMDPPLKLLTLPVQSSWAGESTGSDGTHSFTMAYEATASGPYDERYRIGIPESSYMQTIFEGCYDVEIEYSMTLTGEALPFETGTLYIYFAPGLGIYAFANEGYEYDGETEIDSWEMEYFLTFLATDDRFEIPR